MAPTIFIKFCDFIVHSNSKNMTLSAFLGKTLVTRHFFLIFYPFPNVAPKPTDQSCSNSISMDLWQISPAHSSHFQPSLNIEGTLMLRVVHVRNKKRTDWQTWNFTNMINCFCCYVIKSAGEIATKVLLSIIWNLMLIEIQLSQIRISDSKREKVCALCPYLLFLSVEIILNFPNGQKTPGLVLEKSCRCRIEVIDNDSI